VSIKLMTEFHYLRSISKESMFFVIEERLSYKE
jgi:hypothetical protein